MRLVATKVKTPTEFINHNQVIWHTQEVESDYSISKAPQSKTYVLRTKKEGGEEAGER